MSVFTITPGFRAHKNVHGRRWVTRLIRAGFDDLTAECGVLAAVLAGLTLLVPEIATGAVLAGLLGVVFGMAARQSSREGTREEADHPWRLRVGIALCWCALLVGLVQVGAVVAVVLHG